MTATIKQFFAKHNFLKNLELNKNPCFFQICSSTCYYCLCQWTALWLQVQGRYYNFIYRYNVSTASFVRTHEPYHATGLCLFCTYCFICFTLTHELDKNLYLPVLRQYCFFSFDVMQYEYL